MEHSLTPTSSVAMDASRRATLDLLQHSLGFKLELLALGFKLGLLSLPPTIFGVDERFLVATLKHLLVVEKDLWVISREKELWVSR